MVGTYTRSLFSSLFLSPSRKVSLLAPRPSFSPSAARMNLRVYRRRTDVVHRRWDWETSERETIRQVARGMVEKNGGVAVSWWDLHCRRGVYAEFQGSARRRLWRPSVGMVGTLRTSQEGKSGTYKCVRNIVKTYVSRVCTCSHTHAHNWWANERASESASQQLPVSRVARCSVHIDIFGMARVVHRCTRAQIYDYCTYISVYRWVCMMSRRLLVIL